MQGKEQSGFKGSAMVDQSSRAELLKLNRRLLESIAAADWKTYAELCDPELTCFEPEARGQLVEGMAFHKFYFDLGASGQSGNTTMASPHVRMLGNDAAIVAYVRLVQKLCGDDKPITVATQETRLWQRIDGQWKHVHFHRSPIA
jgi:calcium/calmodulin-dependent protein kinase (CaM kinase) II